MIGLRKYICSQFKPNVAKALYDLFKAKNIMDFSMGWGDRLAGFFASQNTELYVGVDPRKENHPIYREQADYYEGQLTMFETMKKVDFYCEAAEDFYYDGYEDTFDIIFTSPPYFNVERYSHDDNQSWVRHKDINNWNTQFLQKALDSMLPTLRSGGKLCVNISDVYSPSAGKKAWSKICDPMNDFIQSYGGMEYKGCIGMEMAKRPNSGGAGTAKDTKQYTEESLQLAKETKNKRFCEPIWVWEKK